MQRSKEKYKLDKYIRCTVIVKEGHGTEELIVTNFQIYEEEFLNSPINEIRKY